MDQVYINLKEYKYCIPTKLKKLKKDLVNIEELLNIIHDYEDELECMQDKCKELEYELNEYYIPRKVDQENGELL